MFKDEYALPEGELSPRARRMAALRGQTSAAAADAEAPFGSDPFIGMMPPHAQAIARGEDGPAAVRRQMEETDADIRADLARREGEEKKKEGQGLGMLYGLGLLAFNNAEEDRRINNNSAAMQRLQANYKRGVEAGKHGAHKPGAPHEQHTASHHMIDKAAFKSAGANAAIATGFQGAEAYIMKRAEAALFQGAGTSEARAMAAEAAGSAMVNSVGNAVAQGAMFLIPGYTSYYEFQQGNIGSALIWGAADVVGVLGSAFSFGASGAAVTAAKTAKFGIKAAEAFEATAKGVQASNALERAGSAVGKAVMTYKTGEQAYFAKQFYDYTQTAEGQALTAALHAEFLGSGASKEQLMDYVRAKMPHGAAHEYAEIQAKEIEKLMAPQPGHNAKETLEAKAPETSLPPAPTHGNHRVAAPVQAPKFGVDLTLANGPKPPTSEIIG